MDKGAHFHKTDFQIHTPRDLNWKGDGAVTVAERQAYANEFVAACRAKGLGAIAITDHHDFAFLPFIRAAAMAETAADGEVVPESDRLIVFPGLELTLAVPCQALLILDSDFQDEWLGTVLTALAIHPAESELAKHAAIVRLAHIDSFPKLYDALEKQPILKGRFIILPNVGKGETSMMREGFAPKYIEMPCVGGYVDGSLAQLKPGRAANLRGETKEWGNKALGLFQTSDNRDRSFTVLGTFPTWVKWARPTAEALRQACLARHSRISQVEPALPSVQITRVEVSNSKFLGPFDVELNPQYNALIGGRGTGKSSVLEYLRWALCDQPPLTGESEDDRVDFHRRRQALIEKTLRPYNSSVEVRALINGTEHVVRRYVDDGRVMLKIGTDDLRKASEAEVRTLLPLQAYSQKQLSSVGVKSDELRRFVTLPISAGLEELRSKMAEVASKIRATHDALREQQRLQRDRVSSATELHSIEQRLSALRQSLAGVTPEDRAIIDAQPGWSEERRLVDQWRKEAAVALTSVRELTTRLTVLPTPPSTAPVNDALRISAIREHLERLYCGAVQHIGEAEKLLADPESLRLAVATWETAAAANAVKYAEAKSRAAESEVTLKQIADLERRQRELQEVLAENSRRVAELGAPEVRLRERLEEWVAIHSGRTDTLVRQCAVLSQQSKGWLRATVKRGTSVTQIATQLKELVKGSKMRADKFDALLSEVAAAPDPVRAWLEVVEELRSLSELEQPASSPLPQCPRLGSAQLNEQDRRKLAERLQPRGWADFAVASVEDEPRFEYRAREAEYIDFADASAGQQATALMHVLLAQDGPPLVIDQPEDDLDNHVIQDIVEEVWGAKSRRQLIFASHNANLVVNGDAELVVSFDYRKAGDQSGGSIKVQGAIDVADVRHEIAMVIEGGRDAFTLRKNKYGF